MPPAPQADERRRNRVYKSLHRPLTYMGIERKLFIAIGVSAVVMFNLFSSFLGAIAVFIGGVIFGRWVTKTDPAYLNISFGRLSKYKTRYDAAKQAIPKVEIR
jgi:type IV secretory pathway TrbD component